MMKCKICGEGAECFLGGYCPGCHTEAKRAEKDAVQLLRRLVHFESVFSVRMEMKPLIQEGREILNKIDGNN